MSKQETLAQRAQGPSVSECGSGAHPSARIFAPGLFSCMQGWGRRASGAHDQATFLRVSVGAPTALNGGGGNNVTVSDSFPPSVLLFKNSCHSSRGFYNWWLSHLIFPTALGHRKHYPPFSGMDEKGQAICQASEGWSQYVRQHLPTPKPLPLLLTCQTTNRGDPLGL